MPERPQDPWPRARRSEADALLRGGAIEELGFVVEQWSPDESRIEEVLARIGNVMVARIAWLEAVRQRPGRRVLLRQATRVLADSGRPGAGATLDSAVEEALGACEGDALSALRAALVANSYLEAEVERLAAALAERLDPRAAMRRDRAER
jgi:hypothetical protein